MCDFHVVADLVFKVSAESAGRRFLNLHHSDQWTIQDGNIPNRGNIQVGPTHLSFELQDVSNPDK